MANVLVEENSLTAIANSIRGKNGTTNTYKPGEMSAAIDAIETGGNVEAPLVRRTLPSSTSLFFAPARVSAYAAGGRVNYAPSSYHYTYYWYRNSNDNIYWETCAFNKNHFTTGHRYRFSTWIWHDNSANNNEEIELWQNTIFFNNLTSTACSLQKITKDPQLLQVEVDWTSSNDAYGAVFYLYPASSSNQVRLTPIVVEDLTSPADTVPMPV